MFLNEPYSPLEEIPIQAIKWTTENDAVSLLMIKELRTMINESLTEEHRIPFKMYLEGYQYTEIADELMIPLGTLKSRIFFARKKLKALISVRYTTISNKNAA